MEGLFLVVTGDKGREDVVISKLKDFGVDVEERQLDVADFIIYDLYVERKRGDDLRSSIMDGRWRDQCERLAELKREEDVRVCFIIENLDSHLTKYGADKTKHVTGAIASMVYKYGFTVLFTTDEHQTAWWIRRLHDYAAKKTVTKSSTAIRSRPKLANFREEQLYFLQGLPNTGSKRAENLLSEYGSAGAVVDAIKTEVIEYTRGGNAKLGKHSRLAAVDNVGTGWVVAAKEFFGWD